LHEQLSAWGLRSDEVAGGAAALAALRAALTAGEPYELAILDLQMPEMDGLELARAIKGEPALAGVPLVLLTSVGFSPSGAQAREAGIAAYLTKPVRQSQLYDCLATVMASSQHLNAAAADRR